MAESSKQTIPEDFYWVAYLREDIQDLRQDLRHEVTQFRGEMQEMRQEFRGEMQEMRQEFRGEMQEMRGEFRGEIQNIRGDMRASREETNHKFADLAERLEALGKRQNTQFAMLMTMMVSIASVVVAVVKL